MPTLITEHEVQKLLDARSLIASMESAFRERYPSAVIPARTHLNTTEGVFLTMPCYDSVTRALGMKLVMVRQRPSAAEPRVQATYVLLDRDTGSPTLLISANHLTDLRTAATSALATKFLAREDASVLGIFGTGREAEAHLKTLPLVRNFKRALVCGRDLDCTAKFAARMSDQLSFPIEPVDANTCAANSDVICTCTTATEPLFHGNQLRPGTHINAVGAFQPTARELDSVTVKRARVVVDTYEGALAEAGDLLIPMHQGCIGRDHLIADLHELISGKKRGRQNAGEITLFKSVGCALEDLVAAEFIQQALTGGSRQAFR